MGTRESQRIRARAGQPCWSCRCPGKGQLLKGLQVWTRPPQHTNPLCGFLSMKLFVPSSVIWNRGHQAFGWSIYSKEVAHSGDMFTRDLELSLVSGHQEVADLELSNLCRTWIQIEVTGLEALGGFATE